MATNVQVKCIKKDDRDNIHERITHIGGANADSSRWQLSLAAALKGIDDDKWKFWVSVDGKSVWVVAATSASGNRYLKTAADGELENNLLSLPECP